MAEDDKPWRPPATTTDANPYPGPPLPPPADPQWRPAQHDTIPAPRELPQLDHTAIDQAERRAAWLTYAVGAAALAVLVIVAIVNSG